MNWHAACRLLITSGTKSWDITTVIKRHLISLFTFLIFALGAAHAEPIEIKYEIQAFSGGNYSASWLHTATGCTGTGPNTGKRLYMCGYRTAITGQLTGTFEDDVFSINGGYLNIFGSNHAVGASRLGGDFSDTSNNLLWVLNVANFGSFYFEDINMINGPNFLDAQHFKLWGQNSDAYGCDSVGEKSECFPWGIDLYAKRVPEPGTLALIAIGLFAFAMKSKRRRLLIRPLTD